jgi:type II secretory pathway component PulF
MNAFDIWLLKLQFGKNSRLRTYRKLARYHENGVQLQESLKQIISQETRDGKKPKAPIAFAANAWLRKIENGTGFGDAIRGWVPAADVVIIDAGDKAGRIGEALHNACLISESNGRIKSEVLKATVYPVALLFGAFAFMAFFGINVVPAFDAVYPKENWTGIGAQMAWMADFVQTGLLPTIGVLIALSVLLFWSMPRWTGKVRVRLDKVPPYSIYRLMTGSSFLLSMAAMIGAGIHVPEGVRIMLRNSNPWLRERLSKVLFYIRDGYDLGDSLYHQHGLPRLRDRERPARILQDEGLQRDAPPDRQAGDRRHRREDRCPGRHPAQRRHHLHRPGVHVDRRRPVLRAAAVDVRPAAGRLKP